MPVEVVHGDGIVPVAQVVLGVGRLLLPPHAAHCQQDGCGESPSQRSSVGGDKLPKSQWGAEEVVLSPATYPICSVKKMGSCIAGWLELTVKPRVV